MTSLVEIKIFMVFAKSYLILNYVIHKKNYG
jgi:hypothetical protein